MEFDIAPALMEQLTFWHSADAARAQPHADQVVVSCGGSEAPCTFPGMQDLQEAARWLSGMLEQPVLLTITRNRRTMLSYRCTRHGVRLRLHRIFLAATVKQMAALVQFVRGDREAGRVLDKFVEQHAHRVGDCPMPIYTVGTVHDLQSIFAEVNNAFFHGACGARITWGTHVASQGKSALHLGLYLPAQRLICLHPCLDQGFVPRFYVAWVVFHEMLHELFGVSRPTGKRRAGHPPELHVLQSCHVDYQRCKSWENQNLQRLLSFQSPPPRDRGKLTLS